MRRRDFLLLPARRFFPRSRARAALLTPFRWCGGSCCSGGRLKTLAKSRPLQCRGSNGGKGGAGSSPLTMPLHRDDGSSPRSAAAAPVPAIAVRPSNLAAGLSPSCSKAARVTNGI